MQCAKLCRTRAAAVELARQPARQVIQMAPVWKMHSHAVHWREEGMGHQAEIPVSRSATIRNGCLAKREITFGFGICGSSSRPGHGTSEDMPG